MPLSDKELADTLQEIAEQLNQIGIHLTKLQNGLSAVKTILCLQISPADPRLTLEQIQKLEAQFAKLDPYAAARQQFSDILEAIKLMEKHGGPKHS